MSGLDLEIRLLSDVVIPSHSASVGAPTSLGYLPGATLLGVAARLLYEDLKDEAMAAFHTGAVRFGDGLPVGPLGVAALPTPLSFHQGRDGDPGLWFNLARPNPPQDQQLQQVRGGWTLDGLRWRTPERISMRTAIDDAGRAREGLLFGLEAMPAGLVFRARVDADDPALLARIADRMAGRAKIGRSRSAEFGQVDIQVLTPGIAGHDGPAVLDKAAQPGVLVLLCLSDLALRDLQTGQPTLQPAPAALGLPDGWRLDPSHTFLRYRRYSPFNGKRRRPDLERQVITAGSVLTFTGEGEPSLSALRARLDRGVGEHREHGLGRLLVEPEILHKPKFRTIKRSERGDTSIIDISIINRDPLLLWLDQRANERQGRDRRWAVAERWAEALAWARLPRSQWGEVRRLAQVAQTLGEAGPGMLREELQRMILAPERSRHDLPPTQRDHAPKGSGVRALASHWGRKAPDNQRASDVFLKLIEGAWQRTTRDPERLDLPVRDDLPALCELVAERSVRREHHAKEGRGNG